MESVFEGDEWYMAPALAESMGSRFKKNKRLKSGERERGGSRGFFVAMIICILKAKRDNAK